MQRTLCVLMALTFAGACKYSKETVPLERKRADVRVPNQQRLVALAVDEAVEELDFKSLQGSTVALQLSGVFPHNNRDLLAYVYDQVEAKLARSGVRVLEPDPIERELAEGASGLDLVGAIAISRRVTETRPQAETGQEPAPEQEPQPEADYRMSLGISWGGIDMRDKVVTDEPLLTQQLGLGVGGFIGGLILATVSDSTFRKTFAGTVALAAPVGAYLWYRQDTPFPHTYTLIGRVRLVAHAVPTGKGTAFRTDGQGESKIVVDEKNPKGFMLSND